MAAVAAAGGTAVTKFSLDGPIGKGVKASVQRRETAGYKRSDVVDDQYALEEVAPIVAYLRSDSAPIPDLDVLLERDIVRRMGYPNGKRDKTKVVRMRYPFIRPGETETTWQAREAIRREDWPLVANKVRDAKREGIDIIIEALDRHDLDRFDGDAYEEALPLMAARRA